MQGTPGIGKTQEQTTRGILVVRIILNNGRPLTGLTNIMFTDISLNRPLEGMTTELKRSSRKMSAYFLYRVH